jgi:hypothetical protein
MRLLSQRSLGANRDSTVFSLSVALGRFMGKTTTSGKVGAVVRILATNLIMSALKNRGVQDTFCGLDHLRQAFVRRGSDHEGAY